MTSSSKRVIKRPEVSGSLAIENYLPPLEQLLGNTAVVPQKPVFPRYTLEGKKTEDGEVPPEEEPEEEREDEPEDAESVREEPEDADERVNTATGLRLRRGIW